MKNNSGNNYAIVFSDGRMIIAHNCLNIGEAIARWLGIHEIVSVNLITPYNKWQFTRATNWSK